MRSLKIRVFAVLALAVTVSVVAHSLRSAWMDRSQQSSPQASAAQSLPQAPAQTPTPLRQPPDGPPRGVRRPAGAWSV